MLKFIGWPELILFLVIILLIFGIGRISKIAGEIGSGIRAFKDGLSGDKQDTDQSKDDASSDDDL
ncbi:MAG: twin-arginine translocase TatA/TatE family subunit [Anaerolineales bacterium]